jgi:tetratricopeptide (TPR) repeat protein
MKRSPIRLLPAVLLLAGCGGAPRQTAPRDTALQQSAQAGDLAFSLERPEEAATQYERALTRARARDDAAAIGDYGYDLAVAQLAANHPKQALASLRMTRDELARRGAASFPALDLAEATALYRTGAKTESDRLAAQVEAGNDSSAASGASFLRGLIADEAGNESGLEAALAHLAHPGSPVQQADADELAARRDRQRGLFAAAVSEAQRAADLRRTAMDYRGMARALSVAADAAARSGDIRMAADLYMRAGQSAAAQGDATTAGPWLRQALALAHDPALRQTARQMLATLSKATPASGER